MRTSSHIAARAKALVRDQVACSPQRGVSADIPSSQLRVVCWFATCCHPPWAQWQCQPEPHLKGWSAHGSSEAATAACCHFMPCCVLEARFQVQATTFQTAHCISLAGPGTQRTPQKVARNALLHSDGCRLHVSVIAYAAWPTNLSETSQAQFGPQERPLVFMRVLRGRQGVDALPLLHLAKCL